MTNLVIVHQRTPDDVLVHFKDTGNLLVREGSATSFLEHYIAIPEIEEGWPTTKLYAQLRLRPACRSGVESLNSFAVLGSTAAPKLQSRLGESGALNTARFASLTVGGVESVKS